MIILAHRGLWQSPAEKNSRAALRRALEDGFGVETDIRDRAGQLVISHDPPQAEVPTVAEFFEAYAEMGAPGILALNIKADGLQQLLADALALGRFWRRVFRPGKEIQQADVHAADCRKTLVDPGDRFRDSRVRLPKAGGIVDSGGCRL